MFPRIITQTWKDSSSLPPFFEELSLTWRAKHPSYDYRLTDDHWNREFIRTRFPWFLPRYDSYDRNIKRVDAFRYFYLFVFGGIYADLDFECLKSHEALLHTHRGADVILGEMPPSTDGWYRLNALPNALMVSKAGADFWLCVVHHLLHAPEGQPPESETGPVVLRKALLTYERFRGSPSHTRLASLMRPLRPASVVRVLPPVTWYPFGWLQPRCPLPRECLAVTYWTGTWKTYKAGGTPGENSLRGRRVSCSH